MRFIGSTNSIYKTIEAHGRKRRIAAAMPAARASSTFSRLMRAASARAGLDRAMRPSNTAHSSSAIDDTASMTSSDGSSRSRPLRTGRVSLLPIRPRADAADTATLRSRSSRRSIRIKITSERRRILMAELQIRFDDGAAYERMMGTWSRLAGEIFLDWLAPLAGLRWIDVGCGNGAFTELIVERCAPAEVQGIDPSEGQLAFARARPAARMAEFREGDAMALPFPEDRFDAAVMALVIFFVPEPAKGVAEMGRGVRQGGTVACYVCDILGGGM